MILRGKARRVEPRDDVNTDYIIAGRYKFKSEDMKELAQYLMQDLDPKFTERIEAGDFIVAGANFGCGSSREQAPRVILAAGLGAVIAESFARIFYRSSFNLGLPLIEAETGFIRDGDELELDLDAGVLRDVTQQREVPIKPLPPVMQKLLADGGLVEHLKRHGGFALD
ncbi:MAG: 3-isopropylmalate dehydratase [Armatimonadota bacterium]|nr:MAG: 3-isopropylmalate dehydratase [Armatimonadota bacterium]